MSTFKDMAGEQSHISEVFLRVREGWGYRRERGADGWHMGLGLAVQAVPRMKCFTRQGWHEAEEELEVMVCAMEEVGWGTLLAPRGAIIPGHLQLAEFSGHSSFPRSKGWLWSKGWKK